MPSLAETQAAFRAAVTSSDAVVPAMLVAPARLEERLAIYRRHFREALVRHLAGRFPTVEWLLGTGRFMARAEEYVRSSPPSAPCLAEYGSGFVSALQPGDAAGPPAYLPDVASLDWALGDVAVAIDLPPLAIGTLSAYPADRLPDLGLRLQPGLRYLRSQWPVDDLVRIRLGDGPPERLQFAALQVSLEVRGARGQFRISRMEVADFKFRAALGGGHTLGTAIQSGLSADPQFDVTAALAALFAEGLVAEMHFPIEE